MQLKNKVKSCEFGDFLSDALRGYLVCGLQSDMIQCKLFIELDLTFSEAHVVATSMELAASQMKVLQPTAHTAEHHLTASTSSRSRMATHGSTSQAKALDKTRKEKNNVQPRMARQTTSMQQCTRGRVKNITTESLMEDVHSDNSIEMKTILAVPQEHTSIRGAGGVYICSFNNPLTVTMSVEGSHLKMEVNSRDNVSVMSIARYKVLILYISLQLFSLAIQSVTGNLLNVFGQIIPTVTGSKGVQHKLPIVVTAHSPTMLPLLGRHWLDAIFPEWRKTLKIATGEKQVED
ncbi:hypothetical protein PR048_013046 [Dryococelus australis]|uniref:Uncharacterized protein n=1 Tax=Dryococelus australis TaxID=614101 RepID=A0ABQ9HR33_9NEOP|nr:hypothetical protein PR048_013046 [Dryococelus australis]